MKKYLTPLFMWNFIPALILTFECMYFEVTFLSCIAFILAIVNWLAVFDTINLINFKKESFENEKIIKEKINEIKNYDLYELMEQLIGMDKEEAIKLCLENKYTYRIIREDSNNYFFTMDLCPDRINLELDNGVVTKCDNR